MTRAIACIGLVCLLSTGCARKSAAPKVEEDVKPAATATAEEILADYKKNELAGDSKYKDKLIQISGTVAGVGKAPLLGYFVGFGASAEGVDQYDIMCFLDESAKEEAAKLNKGDKVTLKGFCVGRPGGLVLKVNSCVVVK
ncbi:MAG: hypothetical protein U0746_00465 [Gemmataceae bacterium]